MRNLIIGFILGLIIGIFGFKVCVQKTLDAGNTVLKASSKVVDSAGKYLK